ncbi:helix-turn-helix transcriptional regulator [Paenibacillus sp. MMS20-IR301]|uniref:helix-turn-helix domain-containing protein n=1 Tax=Paenibacillus sp. MMS20-IR301 TaxID=2895946 RepID=UPI0028EAA27B|nr:helix-turn-helix transcriptional regulator [Paenibacillus sp. MMS20-IR301]WNS42060.1 helix-turn-helix transcriptional regulator [Paenibacillus sp. MMS20-IR301]
MIDSSKHDDDVYSFIRLIGERIKSIRRSRGLTQEELAERAGIKSSYVTGIETGKRNSSLKTISKLLTALEVEPWELFNFSEIESEELHEKRTNVELIKALLLSRELHEIKLIQKVTRQVFDTIDHSNGK